MEQELFWAIRAARTELEPIANTHKGITRAIEILDNALADIRPAFGVCPICGARFQQPVIGRLKTYCSGKCRQAAHRKGLNKAESTPERPGERWKRTIERKRAETQDGTTRDYEGLFKKADTMIQAEQDKIVL
jgi:hypothetical protein